MSLIKNLVTKLKINNKIINEKIDIQKKTKQSNRISSFFFNLFMSLLLHCLE